MSDPEGFLGSVRDAFKVNVYDTDGDGAADYQELDQPGVRVDDESDDFDTDGDGHVDYQETTGDGQYREHVDVDGDNAWDVVVTHVDTDGDGEADYQESYDPFVVVDDGATADVDSGLMAHVEEALGTDPVDLIEPVDPIEPPEPSVEALIGAEDPFEDGDLVE